VVAIVEVVVVMVVAVAALVAAPDGHVSLAPLDATELPGLSQLMPALVLAFLAYTGYDAISTLAEETPTPRRLIPRATILAVVAVAVFWVIAATLLSSGLPPAVYTAAIDGGGFPLGAAADTAFGDAGRILTDLMGLEATFGLALGATIGAARIPYRMGRDGVIGGRFGTVHPRFRTPWLSITAVLGFVAAVDVLLAVYLSVSLDIALWCVNAVAFFSLTTYLVTNVCNPLLFVRGRGGKPHWLANGVVPLVGVAAVGWFFYKGFFEALWNVDGPLGRSTVFICLGLLGATVIVALACRRRTVTVRPAAARSSR
jgi:amino acid transporter